VGKGLRKREDSFKDVEEEPGIPVVYLWRSEEKNGGKWEQQGGSSGGDSKKNAMSGTIHEWGGRKVQGTAISNISLTQNYNEKIYRELQSLKLG